MPLKRYTVTVKAGRTDVETIMKLTPEEAKRLGGVEYVKGEKPKTETRSARSSSSAAKASTPSANKARTPRANKAQKPAATKKATPPTQKPPAAPAGTDIEDATDPGATD